jgi:hypothetical protein
VTRKRKTRTILGTLKNNLAKNPGGKNTIKTSQDYNNYPMKGGARIKPFTTTKIEYIWFGSKKQKNKPKNKRKKKREIIFFFKL